MFDRVDVISKLQEKLSIFLFDAEFLDVQSTESVEQMQRLQCRLHSTDARFHERLQVCLQHHQCVQSFRFVTQKLCINLTQPSSCLYHLLPHSREPSLLKSYDKFPKVYTCTRRYFSFVDRALNNYQDTIKISNKLIIIFSSKPQFI